jgi:hypothetical protein
MKPVLLFEVVLAASTFYAQILNPTAVAASQSPVNYVIGQQDANSRIWQKVVQSMDAQGNVVSETNQAYVELATGLNHLVNGQWVASREEIDISPGGDSASATNSQHQVYFPGDIYNGPIKLVTLDGQIMVSEPVGLAYFDGSNSVLLATVTNSTGAILPSRTEVIYTNVFAGSGLYADLLYRNTKAGLEQNVVIGQQLPNPSTWNLNPATTRLQMITEFVSSPQPIMTATTVPTAAGNLEDDSLSFGTMMMGRGKAFLIGTNPPSASVNKRWVVLNGRQFLIEEVPFVSIAKAIDALPQFVSQTGTEASKYVVSQNLILPPQRVAEAEPKAQFLTQAALPNRGLVLDYQIINTSQTDLTFQADTTYYVSSGVYLSGTTTFEGGAVIKFNLIPPWYSSWISFLSESVIFHTGTYRPVIFTSKDDNTVGESFGSGTPSNPSIYTPQCLTQSRGSLNVHDARFSWVSGVYAQGGSFSISDCQFVNCGAVANSDAFTSISLKNDLIAHCLIVAELTGGNLYGQNLTIDSLSNQVLVRWDEPVYLPQAYLTNCILTDVSGVAFVNVNHSYCGTGSGVYQSAGAGNYYLATNCPSGIRTNGTTNINSGLLAELRQRTTQPPQLLTSNITSDTQLDPLPIRDTNAAPDLGYHYPALDYIVPNGLAVGDVTLTLANGVALAIAGNQTITFGGGCLNSHGTPANRNHICPNYAVQEQPSPIVPSGTFSLTGTCNLQARFTDFDDVGKAQLMNFNLYNADVRDCNFGAGWVCWYYNIPMVWNNIFERTPVLILSYGYPGPVIIQNNLFWRGYAVTFANPGTASWVVEDNAFDSCNFYYSTQINDVEGYNAYINPGGGFPINWETDVLLDNFTYATGPLGNYYQQSTDLIDHGHTTADQVGLYHYTTQTNQLVEGDSQVDIGFHYVATDQYGNPLDSNADGIPDYLEDANGDGIVNNGETNWALVILNDQYGVPGGTAAFSVQCPSFGQAQYQWQFSSMPISGATNTTLTLTNLQSTNAGVYQVVISYVAGSVTSQPGVLYWPQPPIVASQDPGTDVNLFSGSSATLSAQATNAIGSYEIGYQWSLNGTSLHNSTTNYTIFYAVDANDGTYTVTITNAGGSTNVSWTVYVAGPGSPIWWGNQTIRTWDFVPGIHDVISLAAGANHFVAVRENGSVMAWGDDSLGQTNVPSGLTNVVAVAAGWYHTVALRGDGTVTAWGDNTYGQTDVPPGLTNVVAVSANTYQNLALTRNGTVDYWGDGPSSAPPPAGLSNLTAVTMGGTFGLGLLSNTTVVAWGNNAYGQTNVPVGLSNVVAISAGLYHALALRADGTVVAWGNYALGQTNVPDGLTNAMAIAAGFSHSVALRNDGTVVCWGDNSMGETNAPPTLSHVKLIAAGYHDTLVSIFSPLLQYPVDVTKDLLLIYNTNSTDSVTVLNYYLAHRPMVSGANVLAIGSPGIFVTNGVAFDTTYITNTWVYETVTSCNYTNYVLAPVQAWLSNNPTKRPQYVILFLDVPSRVYDTATTDANYPFYDEGTELPSVSFRLATTIQGWNPFVTHINMNGTNDCIAYVNKIASMGTYSPGKLTISANASGYGNTNYYFDDTENGYQGRPCDTPGLTASNCVVKAGVAVASVTYSNIVDNGTLVGHITNGVHVAGYLSWGAHSTLTNNYATNGFVQWTANGSWWIIETVESFNGQRYRIGQGTYIKWYSSNAFGGMSYSCTPIGAVCHTDEPGLCSINDAGIYFGLWASGKNFAICAWDSRMTEYFLAIGDPFTTQ